MHSSLEADVIEDVIILELEVRVVGAVVSRLHRPDLPLLRVLVSRR
jgi:hypothetical protein